MAAFLLDDVSYVYPAAKTKALDELSLQIDEGEYVAILGMNGSGKSTLARLLAGFFDPTSGTIQRQSGSLAGIVFQQPKEQIVAAVVERDTAFGPQNLAMSKGEIELRVIECLTAVSLADKASSGTMELSLGQTQRLAFAGILALFPDALILDEATALLDVEARGELLGCAERWHKQGHTLIHVTHELDEAMRAERVIVLQGGRKVFDGSQVDFLKDKRVFQCIFGEGGSFLSFADIVERKSSAQVAASESALVVQGLSFSYGEDVVFGNLSLDLKKGCLTSLTGKSGCGKSTLFECLAGLKKATGGTIRATSRPVLALQESDAALFKPFAADDVAFGPSNRGVAGKELLLRVKEAMEAASLPFQEFADRATFSLSGGEKRKLSVAALIALGDDILIFDEPTAGLDPSSRKILLKSLAHLAHSGKTVLFSTHREAEAACADVRLRWEDLAAPSAHKMRATDEASECDVITQQSPLDEASGNLASTPPSVQDAKLQEIPPVANASLLDSVAKAAKVFSSPAAIPSSPISRLSPCAKLALFLLLFVLSIATHSIPLCAAAVIVCAAYCVLAKNPLTRPLKAIACLLPWILVFSIIGGVLLPVYEGDEVLFALGALVLTVPKVLLFARTFLHAFAAIFCVSAFIFTSDERQLMDGLATLLSPLALLKIPVRYFVLTVGIVFRFLPLLLDEMQGILKTQMIRGSFSHAKGIKKVAALASVLVPLVLQTVRKAQVLADALTARYFK